ncbi:Carbonic anhydrase [Quillaja saponaria]|uniref:carbonic anhydrase n=1 Tax=Quillaja saponaria TaxID=32244 RepID=A0AAD7LX77_QUISA|nr:Carbonic anhydrase [Quillaja saponaria]
MVWPIRLVQRTAAFVGSSVYGDSFQCLPFSSLTNSFWGSLRSRPPSNSMKLAKSDGTHMTASLPSIKENPQEAPSNGLKPTQELMGCEAESMARSDCGQDFFDIMKHRFLSFKGHKYMKELDHFQTLAEVQSPKFMVIACADSRVCPSNILGFQPGEAFMIRNIANLVPPLKNGPSETNAALEFAVNTLKVENIFVIGHSSCAGIETLMRMQDDVEVRSFVNKWVVNGEEAKLRTKAAVAHLSFGQQCSFCEKESVNQSLLNLLTYPWIEDKVKKKLVSLHGGYYNFSNCTFERWSLDIERCSVEPGQRRPELVVLLLSRTGLSDAGATMISQFFVLSQRGDSIVFRDYRGEVQKGSAEIFFRKVKFWKEDGQEEAPPVFNVDGVNYFHVKIVGLLFVATTRVNTSPSFVLELLQRIARVIKDYLGVLSEESLRKNFVLVYELLDEVIDFGYVQTTSTEMLKSYVSNEPIVVDAARLSPLGPTSMFVQGTKRMPGIAVTKSVVATEPGGRKREEIFVDIIEKISITFSSSGYILTSEIDGTIQMKSYLTGSPEIRLALNDDLSIGRGSGSIYDYRRSSGSGAVILDDCNFHESVRLDSFDMDKTLTLRPPDGEFPVMNYRLTQEFKPPFRINALIEEAGTLKAEVILKVLSDFSSSVTANTIKVQMPLPKYTTRASFELEPGAVGQTTDFKEAKKRLEWSLKKTVGGSEHTLRAKLTFSQDSHGNITKESGPVSMIFTIPMFNASRLQVKYLQIAKKSGGYEPYRWVRYVTQANSYVARI